MDDGILAKIEKQRLELEEHVAKLRKSLRHWQTLEIDYEGLKEEFQILPENASQEECLEAAKNFKPELVDDKELHLLLEERSGSRKQPSQLVDILSKRVDYVTRNISTVRKQLSDTEKKRNTLLLAQDIEHQDDAGLPLSEITEELDEDGRVISSKVQAPGKEAPDLLEVLRKAGVPDLKDGGTVYGPKLNHEDASNTGLLRETTSDEVISHPPSISTSPDKHQVTEVSDDEELSSDEGKLGPTNPDDSEADAALRQEMLRYGLGEVGAIVAELDLEDSANLSYDEDGNDEYLSDYDEDEDLYTDESEDENGATKNPVISERYKRQMEALSKKHGITDLKNLGPESELSNGIKEELDRPSAAEAARKAAIARDEANKSVFKSKETEENLGSRRKKKKVAFAPSLDIAPETSSEPAPVSKPLLSESTVNPIGETVIERATDESTTTPIAPSTQPPSKPPKISRFKAARSSAPPTPMFPPPKMDFPIPDTSITPSEPLGRTTSNTLIERPISQTTPPTDPSDFDAELHKREVAIEYQKMRNRKIHEQGGFVQGGKEENYGEEVTPAEPVLDESTGMPKKVSRFKAARLKS